LDSMGKNMDKELAEKVGNFTGQQKLERWSA
jgi:hypothetical protein